MARYDNGSASALALDGTGNVYVTGESQGDIATIKYDSGGNQVWVARYDNGVPYAMAIDNANNVYVSGLSQSIDSGIDYVTIKYTQEAIPPIEKKVAIDIKPGSYPNSINLKSKGKVPVAILTTDDFNAQDVDPETCMFAGAVPLRWNMYDLGKDGDNDMILHFRTKDLEDLNKDSTEASIECETYDGIQIIGTDTVNIVPKCKGHDNKVKKYAKKPKKFKMKSKKGK